MKEDLKEKIIDVLQTIFDPEMPANIFDLGLIYAIDISDKMNVNITMTLTAPNCPVAGDIVREVDEKVKTVEGVNDVNVMLTWTPKWDRSMMSEVAQLELGML